MLVGIMPARTPQIHLLVTPQTYEALREESDDNSPLRFHPVSETLEGILIDKNNPSPLIKLPFSFHDLNLFPMPQGFGAPQIPMMLSIFHPDEYGSFFNADGLTERKLDVGGAFPICVYESAHGGRILIFRVPHVIMPAISAEIMSSTPEFEINSNETRLLGMPEHIRQYWGSIVTKLLPFHTLESERNPKVQGFFSLQDIAELVLKGYLKLVEHEDLAYQFIFYWKIGLDLAKLKQTHKFFLPVPEIVISNIPLTHESSQKFYSLGGISDLQGNPLINDGQLVDEEGNPIVNKDGGDFSNLTKLTSTTTIHFGLTSKFDEKGRINLELEAKRAAEDFPTADPEEVEEIDNKNKLNERKKEVKSRLAKKKKST